MVLQYNGKKFSYGKLFISSNLKRKKRYDEILLSWGIDQVIQGGDKDYLKEELLFQERTLFILPRITDVGKFQLEKGPITIQKDGHKVIMHNYYDSFDSECKRIKYHDQVVGDYYAKRNLIILYYNPFPLIPRVRSFQTAISLMSDQVSVITRYDNSEYLNKINLAKSASIFIKNIKTAHGRTQDDIETLNNSINLKGREIISAHHDVRMKVQIQETLRKMLTNFVPEFEKKINDLIQIPFIEGIELTSNGIKVNYGDVNIDYKNKRYYIGNIHIIIKAAAVSVHNSNNINYKDEDEDEDTYDDKHPHPHVNPGGNACFGSFSKDVNDLLGQLEFRRLIFLLKQFLFAYNPKSPLSKIENWKGVIINKNEN